MKSEEAKRRLSARTSTRENKGRKKMSMHGRGMKRFAKPAKKG